MLGMPMYGQSFSLAGNSDHGLNAQTYGGGEAGEETRARGFLAYYEICSNIINKGWAVVRDKKSRIGPYAYLRDQWVSFDDIAMIRHKSEYVKAMGLGGGMIWALDLDDFKNICGCEEYPLLRTINRVLRNYSLPAPKCDLGTDRPVISTTSLAPWQTQKPSTSAPWQTQKPSTSAPWQTQEPDHSSPALACNGRIFVADKQNCNQYYLCNQGQLQLQHCASGLYWNNDHCDWPENTLCHPDGTTPQPSLITIAEEPPRPLQPSYPVVEEGGYKVVCYFTNWAWYRYANPKFHK